MIKLRKKYLLALSCSSLFYFVSVNCDVHILFKYCNRKGALRDKIVSGGATSSTILIIPVYRPRYWYFIQNDMISAKFHRILFWTDMSRYIATWLIYWPISEMNISDISPCDAFEEFLQKVSFPYEFITLNLP